MKLCVVCNIEKSEDEFTADKRKADGLRSECRSCRAVIQERREKTGNLTEQLIAVEQAPKLPATKQERLSFAIELRMEFYRCGALDAMYDLAMMPLSDNSALMQVKYLAARSLGGPMPGDAAGTAIPQPGGPMPDNWLQSLNERFHATAPKLREIRERVATFADGSQERVVTTEG